MATAKRKKKKSVTKRPVKKVLPIPKGYHSITPYLIVNNGAKAIAFYKKVFGAKEAMRMEHSNGKIGHAELKLGDSKIMLSDECPEMGALSPLSFGGSAAIIHFYTKQVDKLFAQAVKAGSKVLRPVENAFYGDRSGMLEDPFGYKWCIATHVENVTPAKIRKRAAELFGKK